MPWYNDFDAFVAQRFPGLEVLSEEPMSKHTTFRIGGPVRRMARPDSPEDCTALLDLAQEQNWPVLLLGNGSNLLAADGEVDLLAVHTGRIDWMNRSDERSIRAGAGVTLARLASFAMREGLDGLAFAHGIPGTLGGAVRMNAGAYGGEMKHVLSRVTAWFPDEGLRVLGVEELDLGYRRSLFSEKRGAVLWAELSLEPGTPEAIRERMEELGRRRREKQPLELPSGGSTFKRPAGDYAAALIERCGLKGTSVGGAQVSAKHAGFVVNTGGATCADVRALIALVQRRVLEETGVKLETEIEIVE